MLLAQNFSLTIAVHYFTCLISQNNQHTVLIMSWDIKTGMVFIYHVGRKI